MTEAGRGLQIKETKERGRGVFARRAFSKDELIEAAPVIVIPSEEWRWIEPTVLYDYTFTFGEQGEHAAIALGLGSIYNHSFEANAGYLCEHAARTIRFVALRDIGEGEEICINYLGAGESGPLWFETGERTRTLPTASVSLGAVPFPEVTVLLGDQSLPDETKRGGAYNDDDVELVTNLKQALAGLTEYRFTFIERHDGMLSQLNRHRPSFVLNFCDEGFGNVPTMELHVAALLEVLGLKYSGAGPACMVRCYDKHLTRAVALDAGVPAPEEVLYESGDPRAVLDRAPPFPLLVKPNFGDGSFGIGRESVVHDAAALTAYVRAFQERYPNRPLLFQELLPGQEFTVGLIGNPGAPFTVLPIVTPDFSRLEEGLPRICGFESKEVPGNPYWEQIEYPVATLEVDLQRRLVSLAEKAFARLGCRDYARFDFRMDAKGVLKLLDANPNPGYNNFGYLGSLGGMSYGDVLRLILQAAQRRVSAACPESVWAF